jgi:hypothetical protein
MDVLKLKHGRQTKRIIPGFEDYSGYYFGLGCICSLVGLRDVGCNRGTGVEKLDYINTCLQVYETKNPN